jgi:REP element-mobilizing transposase RayT
MARGNRRQPIFTDEDDRRFFLGALAEACGRTGWRIHAWVLMGNHYHLFAQTPEPNLSEGMKWLQNTYTRRFNTRHRQWGRLFGDRYKAVPVEQGPGDYYQSLVDYLHLNPVRARLIDLAAGKSLLDYPWSSLASAYALPARRRAPWVAAAEGLAAFNFPDTAAGRRRYVEHLETRAASEPLGRCGTPAGPEDARRSSLQRGWYWGSQAFEEKLHGLLALHPKANTNRTYRSAPEQRQHGLREAKALLEKGLREHGLRAKDLSTLPGSDARKVEIAVRIWEETTVGQGWIADHLVMKSAANVSQILRRAKPNKEPHVKI